MTVAIYARVSSESQEARGTIGSQLEVLRLKMAELGYHVVQEYIDDGYSGARLDRPGLDALRDAAEAGLFKQVWCLTPDRLARSYAYQILVTDELLRHGVQVRYLDAPPLGDDPEARAGLDDAFVLLLLVAGRDEEVRPVASRLLVVLERRRNPLAALRVPAFADELGLVCADALGGLDDPLVDVAEARLGLGDV